MKRTVFFLATSYFSLLAAYGQTIPNPSFELDTFTVFPGYVSGNFAITGWSGTPTDRYGLNPAAGSPFANNGVVPHGTNTAFIQSTGGTSLGTTITDLVDGQSYQLSFRANARNGETPQLNVFVDGLQHIASVIRSVGGTNPYLWVSVDFTASGSTAALRLANNTAADNTVNIDDFQIAPTTSPWRFDLWTDDATSGVDPAFTYTHAYNFGSTASTVINEVLFTGVGGVNPAVSGSFTTAALGSAFVNDANNVTGGSRTLANDFIYNGFPSTFTLSGLTPGKDYLFTLYSVAFDAPNARWATFKSGSDLLTIDQDTFDNNNGIRFEYAYTANASGMLVIETWPLQAGSIHCYGFSNREATPLADTAPAIFAQPVGGSRIIGNSITFSAASTGTRPIAYQWFHGNTSIPGATENRLTVNVTGADDAGFYYVEATNAFGTDTSDSAFLEVYESVPGLLFNTGVDATGAPLAAGSEDPHYLLLANPNGSPLIPAVVQSNIPGAWLPNNAVSQWVGPVADTVGAAGGDYIYQTTFDLTGRPPGLILGGQWATDNPGTAISVNGVPVPGVTLSAGFGAYTTFTANTSLLPPGTVVAGINTLEFSVNNAGAGFTGLRVENLTAAAVPAGIRPVIHKQPQGRDVTTGDIVVLSVQAYGSAELTYQWFLDGGTIPDANGATYTIASTTLADAGSYTVVVTNGEGTDTSDPAVLVATDVPPTITTNPVGGTYGTGEIVQLSVTATGSPTLEYQWQFMGNDIPNADAATYITPPLTHAYEGDYSVTVTNPFGFEDSEVATIIVRDGVPGLFDTGVDETSAVLVDGSVDSHYVLTVNPNGAPLDPVIVEDSTVFPIAPPAGPWVANTDRSKWVGPAFFTDMGAAGDYTYVLGFDLTDFDPSSVIIVGSWATDNAGVDIFLNGVATGNPNPTTQFTALTPFTIATGFQAGTNTLEFVVNNSSVGYTGLRVDGLRGLGTLLPVIDLPEVAIAINGSGNPVIAFHGEQGTTYHLERSPSLLVGEWSDLGILPVPGDGMVSYEDTNAPAGIAHYRVRVTP